VAPEQVAQWGIQAAEGLHYAHQRGVIHRDIKPSNLILDEQGVLWITDFGLARRITDPALTHSGAILGTPRYLSPEQAEAARKPVDHRTDVYSLGATLYELVTHRPAYDGPTPLEIVLQIIDRAPVPPRRLDPAIPRDLETIILKAMAKRPEDRYQTAAELAEDLRRYLKMEPIRARRIGIAGRTVRWCRRNPRLATITGISAAIILTLSGFYYASLLGEIDALEREKQARQETSLALKDLDTARKETDAARRETEREQARLTGVQQQARHVDVRLLHSEAKVLRLSDEPGRRWKSLELLRDAECLREHAQQSSALLEHPGPVPSHPVHPLPARNELRREAVAALLMADARPVRELKGSVLSADGRRAVETTETAIRLLDVSTGQALGQWEFSRHRRVDLAMSDDGQWLAMAEEKVVAGEAITVWELPQKRLVKGLSLPKEIVMTQPSGLQQMMFSSDRRYLAAGFIVPGKTTVKNQIVVWDLQTGAARTLPGAPVSLDVLVFAFDSTGQRLVFQTGKSQLTLWNLETHQKERELDLPHQFAGGVACGPGNQEMAIACYDPKSPDTTILLWDLARNEETLRLKVQGINWEVPYVLAFDSTGSRLAVTHHEPFGDLTVFDLRSGREEFRLQHAHPESILAIAWHPDGKHLITEGFGQSIKVWELAAAPRSLVSTDHLLDANADFACSPDGKWIAMRVLGEKGRLKVCLVDRATGKTRWEHPGTTVPCFRADSQQVAFIAPGPAGSYRPVLFETDNGKEIASPNLARAGVQGDDSANLFFGSEGQLFMARYATNEHRKRALDLMSAFAVNPMTSLLAHLPSGELLERSDYLLDVAGMSGLEVWDLGAGRRIWPGPWDSQVQGGSFSPDGKLLVEIAEEAPGSDRHLTLWEIPSGKIRVRHRMTPGVSYSGPILSADGRWLAVVEQTTEDRRDRMVLFSLPSFERRLAIPPGPWYWGEYFGRFSPDSQLFAFITVDGNIAVWHLERGEELFRWRAFPQDLQGRTFTPQGDIVVGEYGTSNLHILHLGELRRRLAELGLDW
jgi:WD40 repeat protein